MTPANLVFLRAGASLRGGSEGRVGLNESGADGVARPAVTIVIPLRIEKTADQKRFQNLEPSVVCGHGERRRLQ